MIFPRWPPNFEGNLEICQRTCNLEDSDTQNAIESIYDGFMVKVA